MSPGRTTIKRSRRRTVKLAFGLGLLAALAVLALSACGGGEQEIQPRPLPEDEKALQPGVYRSEEFEPSLSFRVGEGWAYEPIEASDQLQIFREQGTGGLGFGVPHHVYKPTKTGTPNVVEAPEDMLGWYQHHPYLRTTEPKPVTVGGVEGVRFDMVVDDLPDGYRGRCGSGCVDGARLRSGSQTFLGEGYTLRLTILEDVEGKTVELGFACWGGEFEAFAPEAQKVIDSVKWQSP
jgi:hypothetical protein